MNRFIKYSKSITAFALACFLYSCTSASKTNITTDDPATAYSIAKSSYDKKEYQQAIEDFGYIKVRFSGTNIIDKSQYYLAMSHFHREEYILAAYEFENLIKNYPTSELAVRARYDLAMCYFMLSPEYFLDQTYTRYAIDAFQTFMELYPTHELVPQAQARISTLRNKLAFKEYNSAEQYMKTDNYRAAVVYYDHVLVDYFDSEYADDALAGKINALIQRKRFDEARAEVARFEEKFPSSPLAGRVASLKTQIP